MSEGHTSPRILMVDDSEEALLVLAKVFEGIGGEVKTAVSGEEALSWVKESISKGEPFNLITLDMRMPQMNGNEVARQIRSLGFDGGIVALTATASLKGKKESESSGIDAYFSKTTLKADLAKAMLEVYGKD